MTNGFHLLCYVVYRTFDDQHFPNHHILQITLILLHLFALLQVGVGGRGRGEREGGRGEGGGEREREEFFISEGSE